MQPKVGHSFILTMASASLALQVQRSLQKKSYGKETASDSAPVNAEYAKCIVIALK